MITIHESGNGADKFKVISYNNGLAYNFCFGEGGSPSRNIFLQGDDAIQIREQFDVAETLNPDKLTREIWFELLDPYL